MTGRSLSLELRWVQLAWLGIVMIGLALGHMALARGTHLLHVIHVSLVAVYLAPVVGAALWWGLRGGALSSVLATAVFTIHVRLGWPGQPVEPVEQWSFIAVFWVVGIVAGVLVDLQAAERARALTLVARGGAPRRPGSNGQPCGGARLPRSLHPGSRRARR